MLQALRSVIEGIASSLDPSARLGEAKDDLSGLRLKTDENAGLRITVTPTMPAELPLLHAHVCLPPSAHPFRVERIERIPSGQILKSSAVLDQEGYQRLIAKLRSLAVRGEVAHVPDLGTLAAP